MSAYTSINSENAKQNLHTIKKKTALYWTILQLRVKEDVFEVQQNNTNKCIR